MERSEKLLQFLNFIFCVSTILGVMTLVAAFFYKDGYSQYLDSESFIHIRWQENPRLQKVNSSIRYIVGIYDRNGKLLAKTHTTIASSLPEKNNIQYFVLYPAIHVAESVEPLSVHSFIFNPLFLCALLSYAAMALLSRKMPVQTDCGSELDTENPQDPFGLKYQAPSDHRHFVVARIHENIDPNDFGDRYLDQLDSKLRESGLGELTGADHTQLDEDERVKFVDLEISLANIDYAVSLCVSTLEACGAPKGSQIIFGEGPNETVIDFGKTEGVALTLDGINLSPAVYETFGLDELLAALSPIFRDRIAEYHGCHTTNTSTELYLYGPSADQILLAIAPVQKEFPLCRNSRTRKIIPQDNNKSD